MIDKSSVSNSPEWELTCVLGNIRQYANEYKLTAAQIRKVFDRGVAAAYALREIDIPVSEPDTHHGHF